MVITTARLTLRPFRLADASAVHAYASDPEVCRYTDWGPNTWEETMGVLELFSAPMGHRIDLAITLTGSDVAIGSIGGGPLPEAHFEVGWVVNRDYWGQGIATEAAQGFIAHMVAQGGIDTVIARCRPENIPSARVMEKLGMAFAERVPRDKEVRGVWVDSLIYALDTPPGSAHRAL